MYLTPEQYALSRRVNANMAKHLESSRAEAEALSHQLNEERQDRDLDMINRRIAERTAPKKPAAKTPAKQRKQEDHLSLFATFLGLCLIVVAVIALMECNQLGLELGLILGGTSLMGMAFVGGMLFAYEKK